METAGSQGAPLAKRKIAFCVAKWADTSTVLSWAWLRQYFFNVSFVSSIRTGVERVPYYLRLSYHHFFKT